MADPDKIDVEYMILADGAQSIGGKMYMLGGGWDRILLPQLPGPLPVPIAVAIGLVVPWSLTNRPFTFGLELADADGGPIPLTPEGRVEIGFEQGRPPGLKAGRPQRIPLTIQVVPNFELPEAGVYEFRATIDGEPLRSIAFEASSLGTSPPTPAG